jgi:hypothetical protein
VLERFPAYRGEYVGHKERVLVPYWRTRRASFLLAGSGEKRKKDEGVDVQFGYGYSPTDPARLPEAVLVDFSHGGLAYDRVKSRSEDKVDYERVSDDSAGEVLFMTPEGKLVLREAATDATNEARDKQIDRVRERNKEVKEGGKKEEKGKELFDNPNP